MWLNIYTYSTFFPYDGFMEVGLLGSVCTRMYTYYQIAFSTAYKMCASFSTWSTAWGCLTPASLQILVSAFKHICFWFTDEKCRCSTLQFPWLLVMLNLVYQKLIGSKFIFDLRSLRTMPDLGLRKSCFSESLCSFMLLPQLLKEETGES